MNFTSFRPKQLKKKGKRQNLTTWNFLFDIFVGKRYLLARRHNNIWSLPLGGFVLAYHAMGIVRDKLVLLKGL